MIDLCLNDWLLITLTIVVCTWYTACQETRWPWRLAQSLLAVSAVCGMRVWYHNTPREPPWVNQLIHSTSFNLNCVLVGLVYQYLYESSRSTRHSLKRLIRWILLLGVVGNPIRWFVRLAALPDSVPGDYISMGLKLSGGGLLAIILYELSWRGVNNHKGDTGEMPPRPVKWSPPGHC